MGAVQVTSMIATGPKPPLTFSNSNDEGTPVKVSIGEGMGEPPTSAWATTTCYFPLAGGSRCLESASSTLFPCLSFSGARSV